MDMRWLLIALVWLMRMEATSAEVCTSTKTASHIQCRNRFEMYSDCTAGTYITYRAVTLKKCCPGSYGNVETGCRDECPHGSAGAVSSACIDSNGQSRLCRNNVCDRSGFQSPPSVIKINENDNEERLLWEVNATCFNQQFSRKNMSFISVNARATHCSVRSENNLVVVKDKLKLYRRACEIPNCLDCSNVDGCLDFPMNYTVQVMCYVHNGGMGIVEHTFLIVAEKAQEVQFNINNEVLDKLILQREGMVGAMVLSFPDLVKPQNEYVDFIILCPRTIDGFPYFKWDGRSHAVVVAADLHHEPSLIFDVQVCAKQRRSENCISFAVHLDIPKDTTTMTPIIDPTGPWGTTLLNIEPTTELPKCQPVTLPPPVPTEPPTPKPCKAIDIWATIPGMDYWCEVICSRIENGCDPYENHCVCLDTTTVHLICHAEGNTWRGNEHMDAWCQLNCNYGDHSHCPTENENKEGYCVCIDPENEDEAESQYDELSESIIGDETESKDNELSESVTGDETESQDNEMSQPATGDANQSQTEDSAESNEEDEVGSSHDETVTSTDDDDVQSSGDSLSSASSNNTDGWGHVDYDDTRWDSNRINA